MDRSRELENCLIELMRSLGMTEVRMMLSLALIRVHRLHEEMVEWVASYRGKEDSLTVQAFMLKLNELTEDNV